MAIKRKIPATDAAQTPATVEAPTQAAVTEAATPLPAPEKLPLRKARSEKAIVQKVATKKPTLKKTPAKTPSPKAPAPEKPEAAASVPGAKKPKLVRDSFTIPKVEYGVLEDLKQRTIGLTRPAKKSELLRAGIKLLNSLPDAELLAALAQVPTIKTGRPAHKK